MHPPPQFDDDLTLSDYLRILRRRWVWVAAPTAAVLALATAVTLVRPPSYCSTAQVLLADSDAQVAIQGDANVSVASRDLANEINFAYSDGVRGDVIETLGREPSVDVEGDEDSDVLWFNSCAESADDAAEHANTWAGVYVQAKQSQAADSIDSAVDGFQVRLDELRRTRQELREPLDELEEDLSDADEESEQIALQAQIERVGAGLEVELRLIDSQIDTIANTVTQLQLDGELAGAGTAQIIQVAAPATTPSNAPLSKNLMLGAVVGLIVGAAAALVIENLDSSIKNADDIDDVAVLATIPLSDRDLGGIDPALATMARTENSVADSYQKLRTAVEFALLGREIRSLLITSPDESEGKSTTSTNLAWALSAVDHRVILADVDFRRPRLHEIFGCGQTPGLSDHLLNKTPLSELALRIDDERGTIVILPTGTRPPSPGDLVASPAFSELIQRLESEADLVVLDSPPILPVSDSLSIARHVDAVIVVARAGQTTRQRLARSIDSLTAVGADVLGVCLIGVDTPGNYTYSLPDTNSRRTKRKARPKQQEVNLIKNRVGR